MQTKRHSSVGFGSRPGATPRGPRAVTSDVGVDLARRERQLTLLHDWRRVLGDAGYVTLLSVLPPMGLLVRDPEVEHRWLSISTNGLLVVFIEDDLGRVQSHYHLLPAGAEVDGAGPSALAVLQTAAEHLTAD